MNIRLVPSLNFKRSSPATFPNFFLLQKFAERIFDAASAVITAAVRDDFRDQALLQQCNGRRMTGRRGMCMGYPAVEKIAQFPSRHVGFGRGHMLEAGYDHV